MQDAVWVYVEINHMLLSCYWILSDAGSRPLLADYSTVKVETPTTYVTKVYFTLLGVHGQYF
jgi:hypothetical protein